MKNIENKEDIKNLIENQVSESVSLDYKEDFTLDNDGKKNMIKDICSFANNQGGFLIYGISEKRNGKFNTSLPDKVVGIKSTDSFEAIKSKLESIISDTIEPFLNVKITGILMDNNEKILVIQIPSSDRKPFVYKNEFIINIRRDTQNDRLDYGTISDIISKKDTVKTQNKSFVNERCSGLSATPNYFLETQFETNHPYLLIHFFQNSHQTIKVKNIHFPDNFTQNDMILRSDTGRKYCSDGLFFSRSQFGQKTFFNSGNVEIFKKITCSQNQHNYQELMFGLPEFSLRLCEEILNTIKITNDNHEFSHISGFSVVVSLLNIYNLKPTNVSASTIPKNIKNNITLVESYVRRDSESLDHILLQVEPTLDNLYQTYGLKECNKSSILNKS